MTLHHVELFADFEENLIAIGVHVDYDFGIVFFDGPETDAVLGAPVFQEVTEHICLEL